MLRQRIVRNCVDNRYWLLVPAVLALVLVYKAWTAASSVRATHADVLQRTVAAVAISDQGYPAPDLARDDVAAFYPCYKNFRAAKEVLRRFRILYPNAPLVMWMDAGGDPRLEQLAARHNASFRALPDRLGLAAWATSYRTPDDFLDLFWKGLEAAAHASKRVILLEDDVWVLRPLLPIPQNEVALSAPGPSIQESHGALVARKCPRMRAPVLLTGNGGTQLLSSWIKAVTHQDVVRAAEIVANVDKLKIPADKTVSVLLACDGKRFVGDRKAVECVEHDMSGFVASPWGEINEYDAEIEAVRRGEVSVLHKIRAFYD